MADPTICDANGTEITIGDLVGCKPEHEGPIRVGTLTRLQWISDEPVITIEINTKGAVSTLQKNPRNVLKVLKVF